MFRFKRTSGCEIGTGKGWHHRECAEARVLLSDHDERVVG